MTRPRAQNCPRHCKNDKVKGTAKWGYETFVLTASKKILVIRFSSIGDVTQCLSVPSKMATLEPREIHWVTRSDLSPLLQGHPHIARIWSYDRKTGMRGLIDLIRQLRAEKFTAIYDAHNNLRSRVIALCLRFPFAPSRLFSQPELLRRPMKRWQRFMLFRLRRNLFRQPFSGQRDLIEPLNKWGINETLPPAPQLFLQEQELAWAQKQLTQQLIFNPTPTPRPSATDGVMTIEREATDRPVRLYRIGLVPSAAYPLKRWPFEYWEKLVTLLPDQLPGVEFVLFGGPTDTFLRPLSSSPRVHSFVGKTNLRETAALVASCDLVIANDTGVLHMAEQTGVRAIALMGPAPFGFPSRPTTHILERELPCRPCSKHGQDPCRNSEFHACLRRISPEEVATLARTILSSPRSLGSEAPC